MNTNPKARRILVYGDCNVFGYEAITEKRYPTNIRWPGQLQIQMGKDFEIIEEGLTRRNSGFDDPNYEGMNGLEGVRPCLLSHQPLDWIILWIGTRDHKDKFGITPEVTTNNMEKIINICQKVSFDNRGRPTKILLVAPTLVTENIFKFSDRYNGAIEKSKLIPKLYKKLASKKSIYFLDASKITLPNELDGMHLDPTGHKLVAEAVWKIVGR